MLKLAIESEQACDPVARTVGSEVLKIFPDDLIKKYKYTMSITEGIIHFQPLFSCVHGSKVLTPFLHLQHGIRDWSSCINDCIH